MSVCEVCGSVYKEVHEQQRFCSRECYAEGVVIPTFEPTARDFLDWCEDKEGTLTNQTLHTKMRNILDACTLERKRKASEDAEKVFRDAMIRYGKRAKKAKKRGRN